MSKWIIETPAGSVEVIGPYRRDGKVTAMTAAEQRDWCQSLGGRRPRKLEFDRIWQTATVQVPTKPRKVTTAALDVLDGDVAAAVAEAGLDFDEARVAAGKTWIEDDSETAAHPVNYGLFVPTIECKGNLWRGIRTYPTSIDEARAIQPPGTAHGWNHADWSQLGYCVLPVGDADRPTRPDLEPPPKMPPPSSKSRPSSPPPADTTVLAGGDVSTRTLKTGIAPGPDVAAWQETLNLDPKPTVWVADLADGTKRSRTWPAEWRWPLTPDGDFGVRTDAATEAWQFRRGLTADGEVGKKTRAAVGKPIATPDAEPPSKLIVPVDGFTKARWYHPGRRHPVTLKMARVDLLMLHTTETPLVAGRARGVARDFAARKDKASSHYISDVAETIQCVADEDTAFCAPGTNHNGLQLEQCGYSYKTDWNTGDGRLVVTSTAALAGHLVITHDIPIAFIDYRGLLLGLRGTSTHLECSKACVVAQGEKMTSSPFYNHKEPKPKSNHQDPPPSPQYPVNYFLEETERRRDEILRARRV